MKPMAKFGVPIIVLVVAIGAAVSLFGLTRDKTGIYRLKRFEMRGTVRQFLDDDRVLLESNRHFEIWNLRKRRSEAKLDYFDGEKLDRAASHALLPDGNRMLIGNERGEVELWDIEAGKMLYSIPVHAAAGKQEGQIPILGLAYSKLRDSFFTSSGYPFVNGKVLPADNLIKEWDLTTGEYKQELTGHMAAIGRLAMLGEGDELLSSSGDGTMRIWDLESGEEVWRVGEPHPPTTSDGDGKGSIEFSHTGRRPLAVSQDGKYFCSYSAVYDVKSRIRIGYLRRGVTNERGVVSLAFSPDNKRVLIGDRGGVIRLWDVATATPIAEATMFKNGAAVSGVAISPSGDRAVSTGVGTIPGFLAMQNKVKVNEGAKMILWHLPEEAAEPASDTPAQKIGNK